MIKIGIIGLENQLHRIVDLMKTVGGFEVTGFYTDDYTNAKEICRGFAIVPYPSVEALFRYVDAVVLNHSFDGDRSIISKCLKHFKHVFLLDSQYLRFDDLVYLEKIAEESTVKFYPGLEGGMPGIISGLAAGKKDLQYIDINHTFALSEGLCSNGRFSLAMLHHLGLVAGLIRANVKKVFANGWNFVEPGAGLLNARLDFDNGSSANIILVNSSTPGQFNVTLYGKSEITKIHALGNHVRVAAESLAKGQLGETECVVSLDQSLKYELEQFQSAIHQVPSGLCAIENKYKSFQMAQLVHEKINHFVSINIFYS